MTQGERALSDKQRFYLVAMKTFSSIKRYGGMLPQNPALVFSPKEIETLFDQGYVAKTSITDEHGREVKGYMLTKKGLNEIHHPHDA